MGLEQVELYLAREMKKPGEKQTLKDLRLLINDANSIGLAGQRIHKVTFPEGETLKIVMHYEKFVEEKEEKKETAP